MKKPIRTFALLGCVALAAWGGWQLFPSDEKKIRRVLEDLAESVSVPDQAKPLSELVALNRLTDLFTPAAEVHVNLPDIGEQNFVGREEIIRAAKVARSDYRGAKVEFLDIIVKKNGTTQTATAELTAKASQDGNRDFFVQEFKFEVRNDGGKWRISRVDMTRTLNLEL